MLGGHALSTAVDRRQLCQHDDKDVGVNVAALCLVDGHADDSAASCMQRGAAIWLFGDCYGRRE